MEINNATGAGYWEEYEDDQGRLVKHWHWLSEGYANELAAESARLNADVAADDAARAAGNPIHHTLQSALAEIANIRADNERMRTIMIEAVVASGFPISGPTDHRAAENGEPKWVCNARQAIAGE